MRGKRADLLFYSLILAFPVLQVCIFYIGVNFNSVILAFQKYGDSGYVWNGWENFKALYIDWTTSTVLKVSLKNTFTSYLITFVISFPLSLLFAFYIQKKFVFASFFKIMLFLPTIVSIVVLVVVFKMSVDKLLPGVLEEITGEEQIGLLANINTRFGTLIFFSIWVSFGVNMLMYVGAMGRIPPSMLEAASLDGITNLQELWHIYLPLIYPTLTTFIVTGVGAIFLNQLNIYTFYGIDASFEIYTLGYYLFRGTQMASLGDYPKLSALGLCFSVVAIPLTFLVKYLLEKFGPEAEEF